MRLLTYVGLVACAAALWAPRALATNGSKLIATGVHAGGRGGADTGIADDANALNTNPAGIAFIDGQRFDSALSWVHPDINSNGPIDDGTSTSNAAGGSMAAVVDFDESWHLGEVLTFDDGGTWDHPPRSSSTYDGTPWKWGFGIFPVKGNRVKLNTLTPFWNADSAAGLPAETQKWESDIKEVLIGPGVGFRINEMLSVGLSGGFIYGEVNQNQPQAQPASILQGHPVGTTGPTYGQAAALTGTKTIEGYASIHHARTYGGRFRVGVMFQPSDVLSFGLSVASPTFKQDWLGTASLDFSRQIKKLEAQPGFAGQIGGSLPSIIAANTNVPESQQTYKGNYNIRIFAVNEPLEVSFGTGIHLGDSFLIGADVYWLEYSQSYKKFSARLYDGSSAELNELTGDTSGTVKNSVPLDWKDCYAFSIGFAWVLPGPLDFMTFRAGYNYGTDPVPQNTLMPTAPAILQHHATVGLSFQIRRIDVTLNFEQDFRASQKITSSQANPDLDGMTIDAAVQFFTFGVGARF